MPPVTVYVPSNAGDSITVSYAGDDPITYPVVDRAVQVGGENVIDFLAIIDGSRVDSEQWTEYVQSKQPASAETPTGGGMSLAEVVHADARTALAAPAEESLAPPAEGSAAPAEESLAPPATGRRSRTSDTAGEGTPDPVTT